MYCINLLISQLKNQFSSNVIQESKGLVSIYDALDMNLFGMNKVGNRFEYTTGGVRS